MISSERLPVPPIKGGAVQTYIAAVAPRLARHHEVTVFSVQGGDLPPEQEIDGVRHVRLAPAFPEATAYLEVLLHHLRQEQFDVIEIFNRPLFVLPIHQVAPASRLVLSLHNEMFRETKIPPELAIATLDVLSHVVTVSRYVADSVRARYPQAAHKLRVIYSGVDVERFPAKGTPEAEAMAAATRQALGWEEGPVILFTGRLSRNKGPHLLVQAMPQVLERYPQARLLLVGSPGHGAQTPTDYAAWLRELAAPLAGHVHFTGFVPYPEIPRYFAAADLFVCPSQWAEPLARVHYEAMAAALPILTTDRGGNPEVVETGVNGLVLEDWHDPQAFARAILELLDDAERAAAMGQAGRRRAEERYTWEHVAKALDEVLTAEPASKGAAQPAGRRQRQTEAGQGPGQGHSQTSTEEAREEAAATPERIPWATVAGPKRAALPAAKSGRKAEWNRSERGTWADTLGQAVFGAWAVRRRQGHPVRPRAPALAFQQRLSPRLLVGAWKGLRAFPRPAMLAETLRKLTMRVQRILDLMAVAEAARHRRRRARHL